MEEKETGVVEETNQEEVKTQDSLTSDQIKELVSEAVGKAVGDNNREWQSRFDKLLTEKKAVAQEKETTEERIKRIEQEREQDKIFNAREKAMLKSGLDEELFKIADMLASKDVDKIQEGASAYKEWVESRVDGLANEKYNKAMDEKQKEVKPPKTGGAIDYDAEIKKAQTAGNIAKVLDLKRKQNGVN